MRKKDIVLGLSLLVCLYIYCFYRTERTLINYLLIQLIHIDNYLAIKTAVKDFLPLNELLIYSLPGGLWVFCITLTSKSYFISIGQQQALSCIFLPLLFSFGIELFQLFDITNGRFDFIDLYTSIIFWVLGLISFPENKKKNIMKSIDGRSYLFVASYAIVYLSHVLY